MFIIEPGDNPLKIEDQIETDPQPPEGFVDSTVKLGRLQPDGSIEWYGTMPAYPEGWDKPKGLKIIPGSGKKKTGEVENMQSRPDKEEIMAKARPMIEAGMSLTKTAKELGVPLGTLGTWIKKEQIIKPEAKPDNFDEEFDALQAKQLARLEPEPEPANEDDTKICTSQRQNYTITQYKEQIKQGDFLPDDTTNDINWVKIEIIKTAIEESEARDLPSKVILDLVSQIKDLEVAGA